MSHQNIPSNLVVDLTTTEQEILTGGCHRLYAREYLRDEDRKDDDNKRYNFLIYRPIVYRPNYFVRA